MIDGRPAAAALIKNSRRVGMTAFLSWRNQVSGVPRCSPLQQPARFRIGLFAFVGKASQLRSHAPSGRPVARWHKHGAMQLGDADTGKTCRMLTSRAN